MLFQDKTLAFIGAGAMGGAIIKGLLNEELVTPEQIIAADPREDRIAELNEQFGIRTTTANLEAAEAANILVLAVKPQMADRVLSGLRGQVHHIDLILSVMAGVDIRWIAGDLQNARVVRSIPNTPTQIGQGMTVWTAAHEVEEEQRKQAAAMLGALGEQLFVEDEKILNMATGLSGSGPAFVFLFMEAMIDAGVHIGLSRQQARQLALQTVKGAVLFTQQSGEHPAILRNQVTSPAGTTTAGLAELEAAGLRTAVLRAVSAAYHRSVELGEDDD